MLIAPGVAQVEGVKDGDALRVGPLTALDVRDLQDGPVSTLSETLVATAWVSLWTVERAPAVPAVALQ